jgi:hypothetical protein
MPGRRRAPSVTDGALRVSGPCCGQPTNGVAPLISTGISRPFGAV